MSWPAAIEYRDALQHPARVFALPELRSCRVETNHLGVPRPRSGASAQVYKFFSHSGVVAVRVFLYPNEQREARYHALSEHLAGVRANCLVGFRYHPQGITIDRGKYPVLTMDWADGVSLGEWLRLKMEKGDIAAVRNMAGRWADMMNELREARIAHGDLQHDNVLVVGDTLKLVDYDGMCVPSLVGQEAFENGKPAYQHPRRVEQRLSLELDHFSAWIVWLALRATAAEPRLWQKYVQKTDNENLLFTEQDLVDPGLSSLWRELMASPDLDVRAWAGRLHATLPKQPFEQIPVFDPGGRRERERALEQFLAVLGSGREAEIVAVWNRLEQAGGHPDAEPHRQRVLLAEERSECLTKLRTIPTHLPADEQDRLWLATWDETLLADCAEAVVLRVRWEKSRDRTEAWKTLEHTLSTKDVARVAAAAAHPLLAGYPPVEEAQPRIREIVERGPRLQQLLERVERRDPSTFDAAEARTCLRDSRDFFGIHREQIASPRRTWPIAPARLFPAHPPLQLVEEGRAIRVRWTWRSLSELRCCLLAVGCFRTPADAPRLVRVEEADYRRGVGGFLIPVPAGLAEISITVWPILNLGWIELAGEPLYLGPLSLREG